MIHYDEYKFDVKSDLLRIKAKTEEYKFEHNDKFGWQYVKDYVRCMYKF